MGLSGRAEGELATPWDVAMGPQDSIYIADFGNRSRQVFRWPVAVAANRAAPSPDR